ncbi:hypothetical protein SAMN05444359_1216 [Neolewinella agarilytica]|uniref:Uncharacterized protein n=1 Tax=Neolewinella agarilytica TaxID=478744 RepID=A0A1H9KL15_9BACT|nr:hypothetical protein SAMN05444359_1216 [Neolewinella agarilytica]
MQGFFELSGKKLLPQSVRLNTLLFLKNFPLHLRGAP